MADIVSNIDKMNDVEISADAPLTQTVMDKIGANINGLIDIAGSFQSETFNSSGTWTAPEGVTSCVVIGCGGGGGAGGANYNGDQGESAGGYGALRGVAFCSVTPFTSYTVTIGAGGAGGSGTSGAAGATGSNTTFGSLATFLGAPGGSGGTFGSSYIVYANSTSRNGGTPGGWGYRMATDMNDGLLGSPANSGEAPFSVDGTGSAYYAGGSGTYGGGGGAGGFGVGANGVSTYPTAGSNAAANTGGGGGGASCNGSADRGGGDGGSGKLIVIWVGAA